jgi:anthranilate synthase component 2
MKILLIDNYDSFTYNLVHYLQELGAKVEVQRNDAISVFQVISGNYNGVVISPGPGDPSDAGISLDLLKTAEDLPILGVCLGHQAIGEAFGGRVVRGEKPMHGKVSDIYHHGKSVFADIPSPFEATRYHSLVVERASIPEVLEVTAETQDGVIMGICHKKLPIHGVQFHPESIASNHGHKLLGNFLKLCSYL